MSYTVFTNREEAGWKLAERLKTIPLKHPLVLAIPRGGVEVGAPLARALGAELDVILSRKLRSPDQPELALGAISETGEVVLNHHLSGMTELGNGHLVEEQKRQMAEIERSKVMFRAVRPRAAVAGRTVIVTDDGIATGSTMIAALKTVRAMGPDQLIVAVPVAPEERLDEIRPLCDRVVCVAAPADFWAVGQFYRDFGQVTDERVIQLLRQEAERRAEGCSGPLGATPG